MPNVTDQEIELILMTIAAERAPKSFCPSEAARRLTDDWRDLMPDIRRVAAQTPLVATQKGIVVDPLTARGPIRLSQKA